MSRLLALVATVVALVLGPTSVPAVASEDWQGDPDAMPSRYSWLSDYEPSDTYTLVVVRGLDRGEVVLALGGVRKRLGRMTPYEAGDYLFEHLDRDYEGPPVVQVERLGHAVVAFLPYGFVHNGALENLSRRRVAASFSTTVEVDTYVVVAGKGELLRQFDAGGKPPKEGALPQEAGLDWGARHQNIYATAWAFLERLTLTHISEDWFYGPHPTFVVKGDKVY